MTLTAHEGAYLLLPAIHVLLVAGKLIHVLMELLVGLAVVDVCRHPEHAGLVRACVGHRQTARRTCTRPQPRHCDTLCSASTPSRSSAYTVRGVDALIFLSSSSWSHLRPPCAPCSSHKSALMCARQLSTPAPPLKG